MSAMTGADADTLDAFIERLQSASYNDHVPWRADLLATASLTIKRLEAGLRIMTEDRDNQRHHRFVAEHRAEVVDREPYDADIIQRLRNGVPMAGETTDATELYDIDAAETTMAEAADKLEGIA